MLNLPMKPVFVISTAVILCTFSAHAALQQSTSVASADYPESRRLAAPNEFPSAGALVTMAVKSDAGPPEGFLAKCSGVLIHERVFLTAGHCICPALPEPPPFARLNVTLEPNAKDQSQWHRVAKVAGHPSLLPCPPPKFTKNWPGAPHRGLSDVGLVFLAEPVRGVAPARLAELNALASPRAGQVGMEIVGYGDLLPVPDEVPPERQFAEWDGLRRVRTRRLAQIVDDTWATWQLPGEVCGGDSGAPIFLDGRVAAVVSFAGKYCRDASIHARVDTPVVRTWIDKTIAANIP